ncbi:MAG: hypothetical protein QM796_08080 [Chthoniobacteraceae bacterium]
MKAVLQVFCVMMSLAAGAMAQLPDRSHSVSLDVNVVSSGGTVSQKGKSLGGGGTDTEGGHYYSSTSVSSTTQARSTEVHIVVRNFRNTPDTVTLEWYFIGADVKNSKKFIFDSGSQSLALNAGEQREQNQRSKELAQVTSRATTTYGALNSDVEYLPSTISTESGKKPKGWIVRLVAGDSVLDAKTSSTSFDEAARNFKSPQDLAKWVQMH